MNEFIRVIRNAIRSKFLPILTKFRYLRNKSYVKTVIFGKIRKWFSGIFNVKPRHKKDYYSVLNWLVSRRLIHAIVILIGSLAIIYLFWINPIYDFSKFKVGDRVYSYSSIPLRFVEGDVKIKAKSGYIAYEGAVSKGHVTGEGKLYDSDRNIVYSGNFENNKYNGVGTLYYPIGQMKYTGEFKDNVFQGNGQLYREGGSLLYEGEFANGYREGQGSLYDGSGKMVFTGMFQKDDIVYSQLLDKTSTDISTIYTGTQQIYQLDNQYMIALEDIKAFYLSQQNDDSIDTELKSVTVYVVKDYLVYGDKVISDVAGLKEVLGKPAFEGNSYITFPECVATKWAQERGSDIDIDTDLITRQTYEELITVENYSKNTLVYLYVYEINDLNYIFLAQEKDAKFFMYEIEK